MATNVVHVTTQVHHSWVARDGAVWAMIEVRVGRLAAVHLMREGDTEGQPHTHRVGS